MYFKKFITMTTIITSSTTLFNKFFTYFQNKDLRFTIDHTLNNTHHSITLYDLTFHQTSSIITLFTKHFHLTQSPAFALAA